MGAFTIGKNMNYSKQYFEAIEQDEKTQALALSSILDEMYSPKSVVDLGAGTGVYLTNFTTSYRYGIDISPISVQFAHDNGHFEVNLGDLRIKNLLEMKYDLALCLEVVEHIGSEYEEVVLGNICSSSDTIILSIAGVGQAGEDHVNLKPMCYWTEEFKKRGFERDYFDEVKIVSHMIHHKPTFWLIRNLMVLKRI